VTRSGNYETFPNWVFLKVFDRLLDGMKPLRENRSAGIDPFCEALEDLRESTTIGVATRSLSRIFLNRNIEEQIFTTFRYLSPKEMKLSLFLYPNGTARTID
jgi:hypothetical protein